MIRIIIAEDHQLVRKGLRLLLTSDFIEVIAEARDGIEAAEKTESLRPDVLLLDLSLPRLSGLEVIRRLLPSPKLRILILTMHADELNVRETLAAGALGYVLKDSPPEELILAIKTVMRNEPYVTPKLRPSLLNRITKAQSAQRERCACITARERHVLELAARGLTSAEIGDRLFISSRTVESHRSKLMRKLQLANQTELVRFAVREKLLDA